MPAESDDALRSRRRKSSRRTRRLEMLLQRRDAFLVAPARRRLEFGFELVRQRLAGLLLGRPSLKLRSLHRLEIGGVRLLRFETPRRESLRVRERRHAQERRQYETDLDRATATG